MARIVRNYHTPWGKTYKGTFFKDNDGIECLKSIFGITAPMRANCNQNCYNLRRRDKATRPAQFCLALATFPDYTANIHDIRKRIPNLRESQILLNAKAICNEAKLTVFNNHTKLWTLTDFGKAYLMWLNGMEPTQVFSWLGEKGEKVNDAAFEKVIGLPSCYKTAAKPTAEKKAESNPIKAKTELRYSIKNETGSPFIEFITDDGGKALLEGKNRIFEITEEIAFKDADSIMNWVRENVPYNAANKILAGEAFALVPRCCRISVMDLLVDNPIILYRDGKGVGVLNSHLFVNTSKITSLYKEYKQLSAREKTMFLDLIKE